MRRKTKMNLPNRCLKHKSLKERRPFKKFKKRLKLYKKMMISYDISFIFYGSEH